MKVKKIDINKSVTDAELKEYKKRSLREETNGRIIGWTGLDMGTELPIITIDIGGEYNRIDLVNPEILETSERRLVYFEFDHEKKDKLRTTIRHQFVKLNTSNMGEVIFESSNDDWADRDELMSDEGLFECVTVQRLIDAINGVTPSDPIRRYNRQVVKQRDIGRNERVMLQSPEGETVFIKYKKAEPLMEQGYQLL